jgi:mxaL protein
MRRLLRIDAAGILLVLAFLSALLACLPLQQLRPRPVYTYIAIVDITRSMNVEDYRRGDRAVSRLEFVRQALQRAVADLPCGSRFGLGVFTERHAALLFEPIETCHGFPAIAEALQHLDWRMAWAADSRIAVGLLDAMNLLQRYDAQLLFITDGQEAPPINPRYRTTFDEVQGRMHGLVIGTGGLTPAPIPKFDPSGRRLGFVEPDEVPHRSTFGLSEMAPDEIEGYHARNAPFGNREVTATEHLSALREDYLRQLAVDSGLSYLRLESGDQLTHALTRRERARTAPSPVDLRPWPAALALLCLAVVYRPLLLMPVRWSRRVSRLRTR